MWNEQQGEYAPTLADFRVPVLAILSTESSDKFVEGLWKQAPTHG
jgi:hypothetical protein